jgi:hypothetical protein
MFVGFLFFLVSGIAFGILYIKLLNKIFPNRKMQKISYFFAVIMFIGFSLSIYIAISISTYCDITITSYSVKVKEYIEKEYSDNNFVKNGVSIDELNNILVHIDNGKEYIKSIIPILDSDNFVIKKVVNYTGRFIDNYVSLIPLKMSYFVGKKHKKIIKTFTDKNDDVTVSSIINGFKSIILKQINKLILTVLLVVNIPFYVYIVLTFIIKVVKSKLYERKQMRSMATIQEKESSFLELESK